MTSLSFCESGNSPPETQATPTLARLDKARQMLAESRTLDEVKHIRDIAEAAKVYAKAAHLGREAQNYAAEISLLAACKAGEILKQLEKKKSSGVPASVAGTSEYAKALKDTATPERTAQHWQRLFNIPEEIREKYIKQTIEAGGEVTASGLLKVRPPTETFHKKDYLKPNPLGAAPITAELTSFQLRLAEYTNLITKQPFLDSRTRGDIEPLIRALLELSKDAAERAMRLSTALEKVAAA